MACNCIERVNQELKEKFGDSAILNFDIYFGSGGSRMHIEGLYHKQKKDGSLEKKQTTINLMPTYCPFCGKKYDEE